MDLAEHGVRDRLRRRRRRAGVRAQLLAAVAAILLGNGLGALFHGVLTTWGPKSGLGQMALGRRAFGFSVNLYSSSLSFATMGVKLPTAFARAATAVVIGVVSLSVAFAVVHDTSSLGNFLLVTAYWTGPWLGVVLADRLLHRPSGNDLATLTDRTHRNWAGSISMVVAAVVSIALFCNQEIYVGLLPRIYPELGDLTFEVGIALAFAL